MNPGKLRYSRTHEWVSAEDGIATIGITDYAQTELGEVVFVELPKVGATLRREGVFGTIESYKTVSDLTCPVSGEVVQANPALGDAPQLVNQSCYDEGWMIKLRMSDPSQLDDLMTAEDYEGSLKEH